MCGGREQWLRLVDVFDVREVQFVSAEYGMAVGSVWMSM
jgi:hypothetical protein